MVELPKADRLRQNDGSGSPRDPLVGWVEYYQHGQDPDFRRRIDDPALQEAHRMLQTLSESEIERLCALSIERARMDWVTARNAATREGRAEGLAEGRAEEQLDRWAAELLDAANLETLFGRS